MVSSTIHSVLYLVALQHRLGQWEWEWGLGRLKFISSSIGWKGYAKILFKKVGVRSRYHALSFMENRSSPGLPRLASTYSWYITRNLFPASSDILVEKSWLGAMSRGDVDSFSSWFLQLQLYLGRRYFLPLWDKDVRIQAARNSTLLADISLRIPSFDKE